MIDRYAVRTTPTVNGSYVLYDDHVKAVNLLKEQLQATQDKLVKEQRALLEWKKMYMETAWAGSK